ncbi:MAG: hypothetical protein O7A09_07170, partial [Proteobacteria bacterium]|nr:hypothetical protein [Pseudomonadota bacterium]
MSGIAGAIDNRRKVSRELLERMAESMRYHPGARVDLWNDGGTALCRLHHEITNRTPQPVFNAERTRCLVLFGELFTGGD